MTQLSCKGLSEGKQSQTSLANERGFAIPFLALVIPVLLICISFVLDLGQAYRTRLHLQRAADSGALAGIGWSLVQKPSPSASPIPPHDASLKSQIEARAANATRANALRNGVTNLVITPTYDVATESLEVEVEGDYKPLLGFRLGVSDPTLKVIAKSERATANIVMALDFSSSMLCPRSAPCDCLSPARTGACPEEKVSDLRDAVDALLGKFNPARDRIGLVLFNIRGNRTVDIANISTQGFTPSSFSIINSRSPGSNTNIADALMSAWGSVNSASLLNNADLNYILVSDGKPTAGRFLFTSPTAGLDATPGAGYLGNYDYLHYSVQWVHDDFTEYSGPGLLTKTAEIPLDYADGTPPRGIAGDDVPTCYSSTPQITLPNPPKLPADFDYAFQNCLYDLGFHLPGSPTVSYGSDCTDFPNCFRQQYYHIPIALSDVLRNQRGTFYTIGIGRPTAIGSDPYQNIDDTSSDASVFLARIANDQLEAVDGATPHPEFVFNNAESYSSLSGLGLQGMGRYFSSPTSEQLTEIFQKIATTVKLRLIK